MSTSKISSYEQQAIDFLKETNTTFSALYFDKDFYFNGDSEKRDIYFIKLKNNRHSYTFKFGQSIANSSTKNTKGKAPNAYDVLSAIEKNGYLTFKDFCDELGYDNDSIKAKKTYKAVKKEYDNIARLFTTTELEKLREIQ